MKARAQKAYTSIKHEGLSHLHISSLRRQSGQQLLENMVLQR